MRFPRGIWGGSWAEKASCTNWKALCASLDRHHYILMYKGRSRPTTERPGELVPQIDILRPRGHVTVSIEDPTPVTVRLANLGDTEWLSRGVGESKAGLDALGSASLRGGRTTARAGLRLVPRSTGSGCRAWRQRHGAARPATPWSRRGLRFAV